MAIPAHQRVTIYGTLIQESGAGTDIYDFGFAVLAGMGDEALATAVDGVLVTAINEYADGWYSTATYGGVRAETIDASGKVTSSYNHSAPGTLVGANTAAVPTFTCMAVTLETGQVDSHGRKVRGRFYPPAMAAAPIGSAVNPTNRDQYAGGWAALLGALVSAGVEIAVASSTSAGLVAVTGVSVDNIVDSMRSRKNRVVSLRSAVIAV